jgi:hypothetical protein
MAGIFISRGMTLSVPPNGLSLSLDKNGKLDGKLTLHVRFDICPTWIEIARRHMQDALVKKVLREEAWSSPDESQRASTLEAECEASMQAIMAAAIALESFYAIVQHNIEIPEELKTTWRTKRTARFKQVSEVLRRAFRLKPKGVAALRQNLREIYRFRDLAVHPSGKIHAPILHPELNTGVEWRFAFFRASNAEMIVNAATETIWQLANHGKAANLAVAEHARTLKERLAAIFPDGHPTGIADKP